MRRCLRGAVRSARSISSIQPIAGSSNTRRGTICLRGGGTGEANACLTVRRLSRCRRASSRSETSGSSLLSLRTRSNNSTRDKPTRPPDTTVVPI